MALDNFLGSDTLTLLALLAVFLIVGYKVLDVLKNVIIVAVLSAVFPHLLNRFFGASFATSLNSEINYVIAGVGMYVIYEFLVVGLQAGGIIWSLFELIAKPFVWFYEGLKSLIPAKKKKEPKIKQQQETEEDDEEPKTKGKAKKNS